MAFQLHVIFFKNHLKSKFFKNKYLKDPKFWKTENFPYISEIKKGSVAFRSGMLQQGDQILFIDNYSLRNKSLTEVNQLLKSTDEIVKLKIKKDESFSGKRGLKKLFVIFSIFFKKKTLMTKQLFIQ